MRAVVFAALVQLAAGVAWAVPSNDACTAAVVVGSVPFTDTRSVSGATAAVDDPDFECAEHNVGGLPSVWYRYTAPAAISLQIDTFGSDFDTVLAVHGGACGAYTGPLACNDDDYDRNFFDEQSRFIVTLAAGETVFIEVLDDDFPPGTLVLNIAESAVFQVSPFVEPGWRPGVAPAGGGGFLIVWDRKFPHDVMARRYDSSGFAVGPRVQVNTSAEDFGMPAVAAGGAGFMVVWQAAADTRARLLDASGVPLGSELVVSSGQDYYPAVAGDALGNFLVAWVDDDGDGYGVFARRYDPLGSPVGAPFAVNAYTTDQQHRPSIAADGAGRFVVTWQSGPSSSNDPSQDGSGFGIFGRRFDSSGLPLGTEFVVNSYTTGSQEYPSVAADAAGNFVVVWADLDGYCFMCIDGRRFASTGTPLGPAFRIEPDTNGLTEGRPASVVTDAGGGFAVAWASTRHVYARRFDAAGAPEATTFQVTHLEAIYQYHPVIAPRAAGQFVVVWDWSPYGSRYDIMGRTVGTPAGGCPSAPLDAPACRHPTLPLRSRLSLRDHSSDSRDTVAWKWVRGAATAPGDFGDPFASDAYALCIYDATGRKLEALVPAGGTCGTEPCWKPTSRGDIVYADRAASADGVRKMRLHPDTDGEAKVTLAGRGERLDLPVLPLAPPVRAQLHASHGQCWEIRFEGAGVEVNSTAEFRALGPP